MKTKRDSGDWWWLVYAAVNFGLLAAVIGLGFVALLASLEIALSIGARAIWQAMGETVRARYAFATLRNLWLIAGGLVLLVAIIYCVNSYFKRWRERRLLRVNLVALAAELLILLAASLLGVI